MAETNGKEETTMEEVTETKQPEAVDNSNNGTSDVTPQPAGNNGAEDAKPETAADEPAGTEPSGETKLTEVAPGQILSGVVRRVEDDLIVVDVGYKADGVVPKSELTLGPGQSPQDMFEEGQTIYVSVLSIDPRDEALLLSERRARAERVWDELNEAMASQRIIKAPVVEAVKGGLVVDVGTRAFMPASHVERGFVSDLNQYVGKTVRARVIELDRGKNRVILSQKLVLEEEYQQLRQSTWESLEEGQVRTGIVKGITDFGAFIDLGGVDGLLHVSEMAWNRVEHPSDVVSEGQEIKVKVMKVDRERERISLSLKQTLPDPWSGIEERYPVGAIVEGQVVRITPFGAFVRLESGVEGLVHISQLADYHVKTPEEVVSEGQTVSVKVLRVQPEERRVSLSIKEANRPAETQTVPEEKQESTTPPSAMAEEKSVSSADAGKQPGSPRSQEPRERERNRNRQRHESTYQVPDQSGDGITLGEMFGDLFEETKERLARLQRAEEEGRSENEAGEAEEESEKED